MVAHLDGVAVAGEEAWTICDQLLAPSSAATVFVVAVRALEERNEPRLQRLFELSTVAPEAVDGLESAFGWVSRETLKGIVARLLASNESLRRLVGVSACAVHRVDPDLSPQGLLEDPDPRVRARAFRTAGEIGRRDLLTACITQIGGQDSETTFWAACSATLLGDSNRALPVLARIAITDGRQRARAFRLALQALSVRGGHSLLKDLASDPTQIRWLIGGSGIAGDPTYVPWLINHMREEKTARLAGEAFTLITGVDLSPLSLDRPQPEGFEPGPTDNPDDPNVDMDPDDGLPWPDVKKVEAWWQANEGHFQKGTRYFMGKPVTREHCIDVLKNGYQRQRILAAHYLCLLEPGTPLFNTSAPAWRQQRLLAAM